MKTELQIQFELKWLSQIDLEQAIENKAILEKINQLLQDIKNLTLILPANSYWPQAKKIIETLATRKECASQLQIEGEMIEPKLKDHIQILGLFNQTRIELSTSMNLLKSFSNASDKQEISRSIDVLGFIGLGIPLSNLAINAYYAFEKWRIDRKNQGKTIEFQHYLEQHQLNLIKTSLIFILNLSNFIGSILQSNSLSLYFNFVNICLEFIFIHLNYIKTKTTLLNRNVELLQSLQHLKSKDEKLDTAFLLNKMQDKVDHATYLKMTEFLMNEQQLKANDALYYFQFGIFALMLTSMLTLQSCGLFDTNTVFLISVLSSYIYNCIQPYLSELFLIATQTEIHEISDGLGQKLYLKQGKLFNSESTKDSLLKPELIFGLLTKSIMPIVVILLAPSLSPPIAIGLICSIHLLITGIEDGLKQLKPSSVKNKKFEAIPDQPPQLEMD